MASPPSDSSCHTPRRRYQRKTPIHQPGVVFPTSPPQIAELAFNIHGWALEDGLAEGRGIYEKINAYRATMIKGGFKAKIDELVAKGEQPYRNDLEYTARELDDTLAERDPAVAQYLIVGYTLQEHEPVFMNNKKFERESDNELIGETPPNDTHFIAWSEVMTPVLVVTPIKENTGTSIRLFGLIAPRSGLCQPVLLQHERVFYRWEFRASAGAKFAQRNKIWNQVAIVKAREFTPEDQLVVNQPMTPSRSPRRPRMKRERRSSTVSDTVSEETVVIKREDDDTMALADTAEVFELHLDLGVLFETTAERRGSYMLDNVDTPVFANVRIVLECQTKSILSGIRQSRESRISRQLEPLLRMLHVNPESLIDAHRLATFCHYQIPVDLQDIHDIAQAIVQNWPELAHLVDVAGVFKIKQFLANTRTFVDFDSLESFLGRALTVVQSNPNPSSKDFQWGIAQARMSAVPKSILLRNNEVVLRAANDLTPDTTFMIFLLRELVKVHDWQRDQEEHMKLRAAPAILVQTDFTYSISPDTLAGKSTDEVLICLQELMAFCHHRLGDAVTDIVLWLERLRLRIRQV